MLPRAQIQDDWSEQLSPSVISKLEQDAAKHWDNFYKQNHDRFFKDRMYLCREFPLLAQPDIAVLEVCVVPCQSQGTLLATHDMPLATWCTQK
jgi:hypothetical protein